MEDSLKEIQLKIEEYEKEMLPPSFWSDKTRAQSIISEIAELKKQLLGKNKYDSGNASISIFAGAGGDDAEDFVRMLFEMYQAFIQKRGWDLQILDISHNDLRGMRSCSFFVSGKNVYKNLKGESGVHRLVRKSPFNKQGKRQTSFALVEVLPELEKNDFSLDESELEISFARSGGAGGQNVNKRETAVRVVHPKTGFSVFISEERTQERNRDRALEIMRAKLYKKFLEDEEKKSKGMTLSDKVSIEWGNQMRSYILDPYQKVKDHQKEIETDDVKSVLAGDIDIFIQES